MAGRWQAGWRRRWAAGGAALGAMLAIAMWCVPARGIVNLKTTPANLVRQAGSILLLEVSPPREKAIEARVIETVKGAAAAERMLRFAFAEPGELTEEELAGAFGASRTATAILLLNKATERSDAPAGLLQINTQWFAIFGKPGQWRIDREKRDIFSIWAGSARMLARAARYVEADPKADFPVRSAMSWDDGAGLGKLAGKANRCIAADLGGATGACAIVLSDGGDRVYRAGAKGPAEITAGIKLGTASKAAALGDFNGDGRVDLASWNGKELVVAIQAGDGTLTASAVKAGLAECLSLEAVDAGGMPGSGLVAGTAGRPALLMPDGRGGFAAQALPRVGVDLGDGGVCIVADFDRDGRCDIMQLFSGGAALYMAEGPGRFKAPVAIRMPLVKNPQAAVCGDYDGDGQLDVVLGGENGLMLLTRDEKQAWETATTITGELAYHGNANQPRIVGGCACDVNNDGRQGVALFYPNRNPLLFFNRGFACFGLARELELTGAESAAGDALDPFAAPAKPRPKAADALQAGQQAGVVMDLNGDGVEDLLGVDRHGKVWALFGKTSGRPGGLAVALSPRHREAVTVAVYEGTRCAGMYVVRPGVPAYVGCSAQGKVRLEWAAANGEKRQRQVEVGEPVRVELAE